jgi:hypothetical protein
MKYTDFVKEVAKYGWEKTRFQGHAFSVVSDVVFVHDDRNGKMDRYYYLSDLKSWYHSYDVMFAYMRNFDLFTMEKLRCTHCGEKVRYMEDKDSPFLYTLKCGCSEFNKIQGEKTKIPDYWIEAKELTEVEQ